MLSYKQLCVNILGEKILNIKYSVLFYSFSAMVCIDLFYEEL